MTPKPPWLAVVESVAPGKLMGLVMPPGAAHPQDVPLYCIVQPEVQPLVTKPSVCVLVPVTTRPPPVVAPEIPLAADPGCPSGMPKFKMAAAVVPLFVTVATDPGGSVLVEPMVTVAAVPVVPGGPVAPVFPVGPVAPVVPCMPCGMEKLKIAALLVPALVTVAFDPAAPVETVPTAMVAAAPAGPVGPVAVVHTHCEEALYCST